MKQLNDITVQERHHSQGNKCHSPPVFKGFKGPKAKDKHLGGFTAVIMPKRYPNTGQHCLRASRYIISAVKYRL